MKKTLKKIAQAFGINLNVYEKKQLGNYYYETSSPVATLAPWNGDEAFKRVYDTIKSNTMVDLYRCYELWTLVEQVEKLGQSGDYLEVGVWRGGTSVLIASRLNMLKSTSVLYAADTFTGVVKVTAADTSYVGGEHNNTSLGIVNDLIKKLKLKNINVLEGIFPDDTVHLVQEPVKFKLCHVDVDIYQSAKDVVSYVWERLIVGGIIIYDDYGFFTCDGITKLVEEQRLLTDRLIIHNLNGHAVVVKLK
jgi:O-methyltransferase